MFCNSCGQQLPDSAKFCGNCGTKQESAESPKHNSGLDLACPKCQSHNTQKITALISSGTTHTEGTISSGGIGENSRDIQETHTSDLVKKFPKPSKQADSAIGITAVLSVTVGWLPGIVIVNWFMSARGDHTFAFFVIFAATIFLLSILAKKAAVEGADYNRNQYPKELHTWENGYYCHRCENVFVPK